MRAMGIESLGFRWLLTAKYIGFTLLENLLTCHSFTSRCNLRLTNRLLVFEVHIDTLFDYPERHFLRMLFDNLISEFFRHIIKCFTGSINMLPDFLVEDFRHADTFLAFLLYGREHMCLACVRLHIVSTCIRHVIKKMPGFPWIKLVEMSMQLSFLK